MTDIFKFITTIDVIIENFKNAKKSERNKVKDFTSKSSKKQKKKIRVYDVK